MIINRILESSAKANEYFRKEDVEVAAKNLDINIDNYDLREIIIGMNIEKEHGSEYGNDVNITGDQAEPTLKIVIAHLREDPEYYTAYVEFKKQREAEGKTNGESQAQVVKECVNAAYLCLTLSKINKNNKFYSKFIAESKSPLSYNVRTAFYENTNFGNVVKGMPLFENAVNKVQLSPTIFRIGAGILPICKGTGRILLGYRSKHSKEPNKWCSFGGKQEPEKGELEENVLNTAKREFTEETGYTGFYNIIPASQFVNGSNTFKFYNNIGIFDDEFEPQLNSEHSEAKWFSLNDIYSLPKEQIHFGIQSLFNDKASIDTIKKYAK